jgi:hypothetical protein
MTDAAVELVAIDVAPLLEPEGTAIPPKHWSKRLGDILGNPKAILGVSAIFFTAYIVFIDVEGGFSNQFLHFGPGTNDQNTTQFLGITLDTWPKVGLMYLASFLSSLMSTYYSYAMTNNLHSYIWNRAIPKVPFSKRWTYVVIIAEPLIMKILYIISFFTNLTLQLQFIIPQFLGSILVDIPFSIQRLQEKEFEFP